MRTHVSPDIPVPVGMPTVDAAEHVALEWLRGNLCPKLTGKRVLLYTYNNSGYFGLMEDAEFVTRYHLEDEELVPAPLRPRSEDASVREGVHTLGSAIQTLATNRHIVQVPAPRQYEGAAVLYGLPH